MNREANATTESERERVQTVASRYCTCGWLNPLRVGKPECEVHALFADRSTLSRLLEAYRTRARLLRAEFA